MTAAMRIASATAAIASAAATSSSIVPFEAPIDYAARPLLIVDLDQTLVSSNPAPFAGAEKLLYALDNSSSGGGAQMMATYTCVRTGARAFLKRMARRYTLAIWSAGGRRYVWTVVGHFFGDIKFHFIWHAEHCTPVVGHADNVASIAMERGEGDPATVAKIPRKRKPLASVVRRYGVPLHRMLLVDDSVYAAYDNIANLVLIPSYTPELNGPERVDYFEPLACFLEQLHDKCGAQGDMGAGVDKTNWLATQLWGSDCTHVLDAMRESMGITPPLSQMLYSVMPPLDIDLAISALRTSPDWPPVCEMA